MKANVPFRYLARMLLVTPAVIVIILALGGIGRNWNLARRVNSTEPQARLHALNHIAAEREAGVRQDVLRVVATEQDREVLGAAAYALLRIGTMADADALLARVASGPDDETRAKLLSYAARLSGRDLRLSTQLTSGATTHEKWARLGSGLGLLELGLPVGGTMLLDLCADPDLQLRSFALEQFQRFLGPMAQTAAHLLECPDAQDPELLPKLEQVRQFWLAYADVTLLSDVLNRLERQDPPWHEVNRLLHARVRVARLMQ